MLNPKIAKKKKASKIFVVKVHNVTLIMMAASQDGKWGVKLKERGRGWSGLDLINLFRRLFVCLSLLTCQS